LVQIVHRHAEELTRQEPNGVVIARRCTHSSTRSPMMMMVLMAMVMMVLMAMMMMVLMAMMMMNDG
jgi:hypothetical protein